MQIEKILKEQHLVQKENLSEKWKDILMGFASQKFLKDVNIELIKKVREINNMRAILLLVNRYESCYH